jgi:hypothetical protein
MWIMTTKGFYSAVQHHDEADLLVVRTRVKEDARELARYLINSDNSPIDPETLIIEKEYADYPFRVIVHREDFREFIGDVVNNLFYPNFKDEVKHIQGLDRARVYSGVWSTLLRLEDFDPEARRYEDDYGYEYDSTDPTLAHITPKRPSLRDRIRNRRFYDWDNNAWINR